MAKFGSCNIGNMSYNAYHVSDTEYLLYTVLCKIDCCSVADISKVV